MPDFSVVTDHPDYQEIISKIVIGTSSKDISNWLKVKYPDADQKHLQLSQKILQDFADKHVDLEAALRRDVLAIKANESTELKISNSLLNNKTYRERVTQLVDEKIDIKQKLHEMVIIGMSRLEQVYDRIQENPTSTKQDYVLLKWFEQMISLYEKVDKIVNNAPDQVIQHNITIQTVEQHTAILQEAIRETILHMDPEMASLFIDILNKKLSAIKPPQLEAPMTLEKTLVEAEVIRDMLELPK